MILLFLTLNIIRIKRIRDHHNKIFKWKEITKKINKNMNKMMVMTMITLIIFKQKLRIFKRRRKKNKQWKQEMIIRNKWNRNLKLIQVRTYHKILILAWNNKGIIILIFQTSLLKASMILKNQIIMKVKVINKNKD